MDYIGKYVKKYESGNKGSLCLESCGYDWGLSAGSYQLTLRWGNCIKFLKKYFNRESSSLYFNENAKDIKTKKWPGLHYSSSPKEVENIWVKCYNKVGKEKFFEYEHEYIKSQYYDRVAKKISKYIELDKTSRAFQELFWSYSVNVGVTGAYNGLIKVLEKLNYKFSNEELFDEIYDERFLDKGTNRYKKDYKDSERETLRPLLKVHGIGVKEIISPIEKKETYNYVVSGESVNVRRGPSKEYDVIKVLHKGDKINIVSKANDWGYISGSGWISLKYVIGG